MKAPLRMQGVYKRTQKQREQKRQEKQEKKYPQGRNHSRKPKAPQQKPYITLHHSNPLGFAPSRTKTPSIIIDIALKVMKFSIPFNLRSGDWDLEMLPLNHLNHDIQKTFYGPLKGNPHSLRHSAASNTAAGEPTTFLETPSLEDSPTSTSGEERLHGRRKSRWQKLTGGSLIATDSKGGEGWWPNGEWEAVIAAKDLANKNLFSCASFLFGEYLISDLDPEG
jgi:hypothetical protein